MDCLSRKIDAQSLMDIANVTENVHPKLFKMNFYQQHIDCGTLGCMIGHWNMINKVFDYNNISFSIIGDKFGLSKQEASFLFHFRETIPVKTITPNNPILAAKRLRKFIYYKLHKQEMLCMDDGSYEKIRRAEGNHNVLKKVLQNV